MDHGIIVSPLYTDQFRNNTKLVDDLIANDIQIYMMSDVEEWDGKSEFRPAQLILIDQAETPMHDIRMMMAEKYAYVPVLTIVTSIMNPSHMEHIFADLANRMIKLSGAKNVKIEFTGLRDGEKLYEEVLNDAEQTKPTTNPKIMIASAREYDYEDALEQDRRLYKASFDYDDMETVKIMKEIVPEYKSQHSKYEALDVA